MPILKKTGITYERVRELFDYDPATGNLTNKVQRGSRAKKGEVAGCLDPDGYIQIWVDWENYKAHRLAWLHYHGYLPENDIDHEDRIKHHNWIANLREVSHVCNMRNSGNNKRNKSGVRGVRFNKQSGKWDSQIVSYKVRTNLGSYIDFDNAVCARLAGEQCLNWAGCNSSSPAYKYVQKMLNNN